MPMQRNTITSGGDAYATVGMFVGDMGPTEQITVDLSDLTTDEVDGDGFLKPGVPLKSDGTLADATAGEFIYGITLEPVFTGVDSVAADTDLDAATDIQVAVARSGLVNRDVVEDTLGRALTANELAAFTAAGSNLMLTGT